MRHHLFSPLFIICIIFFGFHQFAESILNNHFVFADNYLDPFLCMPIILGIYTWEKEFVFRKGPYIPLSEIIALTLVVAFVAEIIFPHINSKCIGDWYDVPAYAAGTCLYVVTCK